MKNEPIDRAARRRPANISLDRELLEAAKALGVNVSRACEEGLAREVARTRTERWQEENAEAIDGWNRYVEEHGLPLARYRQF